MKSKIIILFFLIALGSENLIAQERDESFTKTLLEKFCQEKYSDCFSGRTYINYSIEIEEWKMSGITTIKASGTHSYKGKFGWRYEKMDYIAYITIGLNSISVEFHKKSKADLFNSEDYWEECTKKVRYN